MTPGCVAPMHPCTHLMIMVSSATSAGGDYRVAVSAHRDESGPLRLVISSDFYAVRAGDANPARLKH